MRNIYLIGMMGSGKTTSGRALAKLMGLGFVDLDERIMERTGRSINDIFKSDGEPYFRKVEREVLMQVAAKQGQVVATGGGVVLDPANGERMRQTGLMIYLKTSAEVLWERVKHKKDRPLLGVQDPEKALAGLYQTRLSYYESFADKTFLTDRKTPESVALEIFKTCFESKAAK